MPPNPSGLHYEPYEEVKDAYELSDGQLIELYNTNDCHEGVRERRAALITLVESWV